MLDFNLRANYNISILYDFTKDIGLDNFRAEMHFHKNAYSTLHSHKNPEIIIMVSGESMHYINGHYHKMLQNDFAVILPGAEHRFDLTSEKSESMHLVLSITPKLAVQIVQILSPELLDKLEGKPYFHGHMSAKDVQTLVALGNEMLICPYFETEYKQTIPIVAFVEFIKIMISQNRISQKSYPEWFKDLIMQMNRIETFDFSIENLCKITGYSHSQLLRHFKTYTGRTVNRYISDVKLDYSCSLLKYTNNTTLEICMKLGFYSLSHFNHLFKAKFGLTPSEYRKLNT